jgi:hypothetical protein
MHQHSRRFAALLTQSTLARCRQRWFLHYTAPSLDVALYQRAHPLFLESPPCFTTPPAAAAASLLCFSQRSMSPARSRLSFLFSRVALVGMPMRLRVLIICNTRGYTPHKRRSEYCCVLTPPPPLLQRLIQSIAWTEHTWRYAQRRVLGHTSSSRDMQYEPYSGTIAGAGLIAPLPWHACTCMSTPGSLITWAVPGVRTVPCSRRIRRGVSPPAATAAAG